MYEVKNEVNIEKDFNTLSDELRSFLTTAGYPSEIELAVFENNEEDVLEIHATAESTVDPLYVYTDTIEFDDAYSHQIDEMKLLSMVYGKDVCVHQINKESITFKRRGGLI